MKRYLFGESIQGASHKRQAKVCQDSHRIDSGRDIAIVSVADGHGSESCPYSKTGSVIAVNVFNSVMAIYYASYKKQRNGVKALMRFLNREGDLKVAKTIDEEWKRRVYKQHCNRHREIPLDKDGNPDKDAVYKMYGCTLLGLVITNSYTFAFQLGDGDITYCDATSTLPLIEPDKLLGVETHSLSGKDSWKKAIASVKARDIKKGTPYMYMLSTDGMANSFRSQEEFEKTCANYYETIQDYGFEAIEDNLSDWLEETSEQGCGDDVTAVFAYYE